MSIPKYKMSPLENHKYILLEGLKKKRHMVRINHGMLLDTILVMTEDKKNWVKVTGLMSEI
jgi:hypothetical protein